MQNKRKWCAGIALFTLLTCIASGAGAGDGRHKTPKGFDELLQKSMADKSGLEFYVNGQVIPGVVTAITDDGAVEVRNQTRDRIVIPVRRIDAIGQ